MFTTLTVYLFINWFNTSTAEEAVWSDEFTYMDSRWDWNYNSGTGYKQLTTIDGVSVVEIGITGQSSSSSYSDCSLHETSYQHTYGIFEARLRCTDDNGFNQSGHGTRGWGFWNFNDPTKADAAWFWSASPESDTSVVGFQVMVIRDSTIVFQKSLPGIDMREWHIYRVELLCTGTRFLVDGNEVATTSQCPDKLQRIEMWIDNYCIQVIDNQLQPAGYLNVQNDQMMYIDWVKYYDGDADDDDIPDACDNCPYTPNGPDLGYCAQTECFTFRYSTHLCSSNDDCVGPCMTCLMNQEDNYPPGGNDTGDACEWCYADLDGSGDVYPDDAMILLGEWKRKNCSAENPCQADIDGDGKVYPADAMILLSEWKRKDCPVLP